MKKMKNTKELYKKVTKWKKKPKYDNLTGGMLFLIVGCGMVFFLSIQDKQVAMLSMVFTFMITFGGRLCLKGFGEGRRTYFMKTKLKKIGK